MAVGAELEMKMESKWFGMETGGWKWHWHWQREREWEWSWFFV